MSLSARIRNRLALIDKTRNLPMNAKSAAASFTFDDFPVSAAEIGAGMLEDAGVHGSFFACEELMGTVSEAGAHYQPEHLVRLKEAGHEIGCHAARHVPLGSETASSIRSLLHGNQEYVKSILGPDYSMTSFAYPFGDVSLTAKHVASDEYAVCRGVRQGPNTGSIDLAQLSVISLEIRHWDEAAMVRTIEEAVEAKSWLVFLTHDIQEDCTPYGSTPKMLEWTIRKVQEAGIPIMTCKAGAAHSLFSGQA